MYVLISIVVVLLLAVVQSKAPLRPEGSEGVEGSF